MTRQPAMPMSENSVNETRKLLSASRFLPCAYAMLTMREIATGAPEVASRLKKMKISYAV